MNNNPTARPDQGTAKDHAPVVRRRTPSFPTRFASYFDCTKWGSGFFRVANQGPGAAVLNKAGHLLNLQTGEVYLDERFVEEAP